MANTGLKFGPLPLTPESLKQVEKKIGVFALGTAVVIDGCLLPDKVLRVGRSDTDLKGYLEHFLRPKGSHVNDAKGCTHLEYDYFDTIEKAYIKECLLYHEFKPRNNKEHPPKPEGMNSLKCPIENLAEQQ